MKIVIITLLLVLIGNNIWAQTDSLKTEKKYQNYISIGQEYSWFDDELPDWNTTTLEGKLKKDSWTFLPRLTVANRFEQWGWLVEQDVYKKTKKENYFFLQAGGSNSTVFPNIKGSIEYFHPFAKKWELSLGVRYLKFNNVADVGITTTSLSHYYGKFLTIARAYVGVASNTNGVNNFSGSLIQRYYHTDETYTSLFVNYGYDPSTLLFDGNTSLSVSRFTQFNVGINRLQQLSTRVAGLLQAELTSYNFGATSRNQYSVSMKIMYKLP